VELPLRPTPKCRRCGAELRLGKSGEVDAWSCPAGHGLGITISEAHGRLQDDEIAKIWSAAKTAPAAGYSCPLCGDPMVGVTVGIDDEEAAEGEAGDRADTTKVALEVCIDDAFFWFDAGELDEFPQDIPTPPPSPEEQRKIDLIVNTFSRELEEAYEAEDERGIMNKVANYIVRRDPGFASFLAHALYSRKLDEL
jgi:hypothetical protein